MLSCNAQRHRRGAMRTSCAAQCAPAAVAGGTCRWISEPLYTDLPSIHSSKDPSAQARSYLQNAI
jgi:hypothetical protein